MDDPVDRAAEKAEGWEESGGNSVGPSNIVHSIGDFLREPEVGKLLYCNGKDKSGGKPGRG